MKKPYKLIGLTIGSILFFTTLSVAETQFNLEVEKSKLSNKVFNHYDFDKNKALSFEEFSTFSKHMKEKEQEKRVEKTIISCDKNNNGEIELSEVPTAKEMMEAFKHAGKNIRKLCRMEKMQFAQNDENKDERITKEELLNAYTQQRNGIWKRMPPPIPIEMPEANYLEEFKGQLTRCDKNGDGNITLTEATANMCYMTSDEFLQYSSDANKSFEIKTVAHTPKLNQESQFNHRFNICDNNKDKKLNLVEATSQWCHLSSDEFIRLDTDKNQYLVNSELKKQYAEKSSSTMPKIPFKIMKDMPPEAQISIAFGQCDEDKNRKLSKDEAKKCELSIEIFEKFDSDKSNTIEINDIEMMQKRREFEMVDMNSDKKIDPKEFEERMGNRCQIF